MNKNLLALFLLLSATLLKAQSLSHEKLNQQISEFNNNYKYNESIIRLEQVINNNQSSEFDLYNAYLQKALTYKRLYNYPEVLKNLDLALAHGLNSETQHQREKAEIKILAEKMFVVFDTQKVGSVDNRVDEYIKQIRSKDIGLLSPSTTAFYYNVVGVRQMLKNEYNAAEKTFNEGIATLEKRSPQHLPMVYSKLIVLAEYTGKVENAIKAYEKGMYYANKYHIDLYKKALYFSMSRLYEKRKQYKEAYYYQNKGTELDFEYNARYYNGQLTVLENDLLDKRKNKQIEIEKRTTLFFIILSLITLVLIGVLFMLYKSNKQKRILIEKENKRIRTELEKLINSDKKEDSINPDGYNLTPRQLEIIDLLKGGNTNKEIGEKLFISENTVKYHLKIIYNVLGVENRYDLKA